MRHVASDTLLVFGRYGRQTLRSKLGLVFGLLQPLLFLVFFGPLLKDVPLGGRGDSWQTLVPGLLVQLGLFSAAFAGFAILLEKQWGVIERMQVTPVSRLALLMGRVLKDVVALFVQSLLLVLVAVAMGLRAPLFGVLLGFLFVGTLTISLASLSYALAMRVSTPQEFAPVINAVNLPAMLLSGILLPMALAPDWLDTVSHFVPFRYLVDGVRAAFVGDYGDGKVALAALVAAALAVVSVTIGTRLFRKSGA
ncbi:ABC transporter permease [Streptomyces sp. XD-27]|uniref:ABC transporter permease n=1 Tax=Streptomyces sp. XD-27 TaxID=3062779 RepID=UPI0026F40ED1|nr:ABC transporter permease [Streptomyces sp. XD-27]WKX72637.1 ABC transporter permease [Streptomyces sp. XD-27]